jgi:hypothetical protein
MPAPTNSQKIEDLRRNQADTERELAVFVSTQKIRQENLENSLTSPQKSPLSKNVANPSSLILLAPCKFGSPYSERHLHFLSHC